MWINQERKKVNNNALITLIFRGAHIFYRQPQTDSRKLPELSANFKRGAVGYQLSNLRKGFIVIRDSLQRLG